ETANAAAMNKANNLIAIVDVNRLGQSQQTMHGHNLDAYRRKFEAFGWNTAVIDGHDVDAILKALKSSGKGDQPLVILAKTRKGKGFSEAEGREGWHGKPFDKDVMQRALKEIKAKGADAKLKSQVRYRKLPEINYLGFTITNYNIGEMVATRNAFGNALVKLGEDCKETVVVDGDVKNSTMTDGFFKRFPERSFESYIAEQNMIGMTMGFSAAGLLPFTATFAAFLTRAHDFIRMATYSGSNIKICGSHAGISIGEDGASQMGLEDISMFLSMPDSLVLYPSDAVSAEKCVQIMAAHNGISYLRTTRSKTPVIYSINDEFKAGGLKVLRKSSKDKALVIGAGITLHEALKAYDNLKNKNKNIRVIDLYSVRPVDSALLIKNAKECKNRVIVVEDHYFGGIGAVVKDVLGKGCEIQHLYVKDTPRSGSPEQLMKKYYIDSSAIVKAAGKWA
ncbi:MAG: transketolase, partial [Nanoarchaeota archaeon]|nr:transketolase [Nanoarchaeota archaeon]